MAVVIPESGAVAIATLVQGRLEITLNKPAADAKVGVSLVGSPPLVHQVRGLGAAAGLRLHDRVVSVNWLPVLGQDDAVAALAAAPPGPLVVVVERIVTPVQGRLEITLNKPAADAKVGVSLVGSPPLVHQVRGLGAAAGLRLHDRVVSVNGLPVSGQDDAVAALAAAPPGPLVVVVEPREPPPTAPGGGHYLREHHCGDNAWLEVCCGCGFVIYGDVREVYLAPDGRRFSARGEEVVRGTWDDYSAQPCYPSKDVVAAAKAPRPQSVQRT